jgi:hypothetical protein
VIEAWKIGVNIAMTSNASQVLGVLGRDLFGLGKAADQLAGKLNLVKLAAWGAVGVLAGGAAITGLGKLAEKGAELVHQQALFKSALLDSGKTAKQIASDVNDATQTAWKATQQVPGTTWAGNLQSIRELRTVFGNTQTAEQQLPNLLKASMILQSLLPGAGAGDQVFDLAKALEIKGKSMDPQQFNAMLGEFIQAEIASGGKVTGTDFLSAFKFGRTATQSWSDEFVGQILPTLIQEMKGGGMMSGATGPGNALQSAFQAVVGGAMSNKAADEFSHLGLLDAHKIIHTRTGNIKGVEPGGVAGSSEFEANPYKWVQDYLVPALRSHHITTPDAIREEIAHLFVNRTAQQIMTMFATQQQRFEKDAELNRQAGGLNTYAQLLQDDPTMKMKNFTAAWQNLLQALGAPLVDTAYNLMGKLTVAMNDFSNWAANHQELVGIIEKIVGALAALAIAIGGLAVATAAVAALTPLGAAIAGVTAAAVVLTGGLQGLDHVLHDMFPWAYGGKNNDPLKNFTENREKNGLAFPSWWPKWMQPSDAVSVPAVPSAAGNTQPSIQMTGNVNLSGKKVGTFVANSVADQLTKPKTGTTGVNTSVSAPMPGQTTSVNGQ